MNVVSAIQNTVPISQFNRGLAGQIFEDVKTHGAKVVMKNNVAECVLLFGMYRTEAFPLCCSPRRNIYA